MFSWWLTIKAKNVKIPKMNHKHEAQPSRGTKRKEIRNKQLQNKRMHLFTQISIMDFPILIHWVSPFVFQGVSGVFFSFFSICNGNVCYECRLMRRLIKVCNVCLCPTKVTPGLYGLKQLQEITALEESVEKTTGRLKPVANPRS